MVVCYTEINEVIVPNPMNITLIYVLMCIVQIQYLCLWGFASFSASEVIDTPCSIDPVLSTVSEIRM